MWRGRFDLFNSFIGNERGGAGMLFSIAVLPMMAFVGASVDLGNVHLARTHLQEAVDASALAASRNFQTTRNLDSATALANNMFAAAAPRNVQSAISSVTVDPQTGSVDLTASAAVPTPIMAAFSSSFHQMQVSASAQVIARETGLGKNLEVSLMLDVTSSMSSGSGTAGLTKLQAMQSAAKNLIATVVASDQSHRTSRAALAPFSAAVNVGAYFSAVTNTTPTGTWTSVTERAGASAFTDDPPRGGAWLPSYRSTHTSAKSPNFFYARIEQNRTSNIPSASKILPLTNDKAALNSAIDAFTADGTTAGHIGIAWSWYLLSPAWTSVWPAAGAPATYGRDTLKVAILMSDVDFNVYYQSGNGDMNTQAQRLCDNMKAAGVVIYTVGFQVDTAKQASVDLFQTCASDSSKAISAETGAELLTAYQTIANTVLDSVSSPVRLAR